ncbi:MAG: MFS transporter [Chloroflexota bacterium]
MTADERIDPSVRRGLEAISQSESPAWLLLGLLWLVANCLRLPILAVPPLLPAIHHSLQLSESLVGALSGLPILVLALAAVPGSFVISQLGARRSVLLGLVLCAIGGGTRGAFSSTPLLFAMTFVMAAGIAISQPALPSLVRQWFPGKTGPATAVYSNGFLIGEIVAASLTVPLIMPLVGSRWERAFGLWSLPVLVTAALLLLLAPHTQKTATAAPVQWWPDWRSMQTWRLGLTFGCASIAYFGSNAFLPDYLRATHHSGQLSVALASLNICQLPSSVLVVALSDRLIGRRWPIVAAGGAIVASVVGLAVVPALVAVWGGVIGLSSALVFVLALALPPLIADAGDVHRLSAAMFTMSYTCAAAGSFLGGASWDVTGIPVVAFAPVAVGGCLMMALAVDARHPAG